LPVRTPGTKLPHQRRPISHPTAFKNTLKHVFKQKLEVCGTAAESDDVRPPGAASPSAKSIQEDEISLAVMAGRMKKFSENTSTIPKVMDSSTLNVNTDFKFSRFIFFGGGPRPTSGVC